MRRNAGGVVVTHSQRAGGVQRAARFSPVMQRCRGGAVQEQGGGRDLEAVREFECECARVVDSVE